jgi:D-arabinose 1-dehydrogenase-like Zn-dependent alcohol dehydrogenase
LPSKLLNLVARPSVASMMRVKALPRCSVSESCRRGGATVCPLATRRELPVPSRLRVSSRWVVALGDGLELPLPAAAAVAGDVTTAYTLYARTGLSSREPVVILGTNAVTRFLVEILRGKGITPTVVVDGEPPSWRDWLLGKGAAAVSGHDATLAQTVTAAIAAQGQGARPWRLIVTDPRELPRAATLAGPRATLTVLTNGAVPALPGDVLAREVTVIGVAGPHPDLVVEAAALCVKGEIDLASGVEIGEPRDVTRATVVPL